MFNKETLSAYSIADLRAMKTIANEIIKERLTIEEETNKANKLTADEANQTKGREYITDKKAGDKVSIKVGDTTEILEIKNINFDKETVSGYRLDAEGNRKHNKDGKVATLWKYFKDLVVPEITEAAE